VEEEEHPIHFEANRKDVQLLVRTGQAETSGAGWAFGRYGGPAYYSGHTVQYANLCTAPCDATLPTGSHRLALALQGGKALEGEHAIEIDGPTSIRGNYESRAGIRIAGLFVLLGSAIGGTALMVSAIHTGGTTCNNNYCASGTSSNIDSGALWGGLAVVGIGSLVGAVMLLIKDNVTIEVARGDDARALTLPRATREAPVLTPEALALPGGGGLGLRLRM
jgi:hypothetical protein